MRGSIIGEHHNVVERRAADRRGSLLAAMEMATTGMKVGGRMVRKPKNVHVQHFPLKTMSVSYSCPKI